VLLQHHLQAVGDAVEEAPPDQLELGEGNPDVGAVGADAIGHHRRLLALDPGEDRAEGDQHPHRVDDEDERDAEVLRHGASTGAGTASATNRWAASATLAGLSKQASKRLTTPAKFV